MNTKTNSKVNKLAILALAITAAWTALFGSLTSVFAQESQARVRVVHASPDAPDVDVWAEDSPAFTGVSFADVSDYASLDAGTYNVQVVPAGETEPAVIDADLTLDSAKDYTVVAVGTLDNIEPLVLIDNNTAPEAGKAHVRFVHASPDAPAVDIAVKDGPVLFENVAFKQVGAYLPVDATTYDIEVRIAGTEDVALEVPGLTVDEGVVYTVFAMGLAGGEPALQAVPSVDATHDSSGAGMAADEGASTSTASGAADEMPATLPKTGAEDYLPHLMLLSAALIAGGLALNKRGAVQVRR